MYFLQVKHTLCIFRNKAKIADLKMRMTLLYYNLISITKQNVEYHYTLMGKMNQYCDRGDPRETPEGL